MSNIYLLDANAFIEAKNRYYEFDIEYVNTFEMLRELMEKFIRSTKRTGPRRKKRSS